MIIALNSVSGRFMDTATDSQQQLHLLYRDHHGWLQGWLRKRLGDREHAADVVVMQHGLDFCLSPHGLLR